MSTVVVQHKQLPAGVARLAAMATLETVNELSGGIGAGFPVISYKGKVWRIKEGGESTMHLDDEGNAMPQIEIVLLQANPALSKIYYDKGFVEGSTEPPRCFSTNSIAPDISVVEPINATCANCPKNAWGSKITEQGKKGKACQDSRRMAVAFAGDLLENGKDCKKYLLRVPPASLNPLKDYAEKILAPRGIPFFGMVTKIGFAPESAHPQFTFKAARFLNDEEADAVGTIRNSAEVKKILAEAQDFEAPAAAPPAQPADGFAPAAAPPPKAAATVATPAAQPAAKSAPKKAPMRPATDEEAGEASVAPVVAKPAARSVAKPATVEDDAFAFEAPTETVKPKAAAKPVKAAKPPVVEAEEAAEESVPVSPDSGDFDNLLDSILNG